MRRVLPPAGLAFVLAAAGAHATELPLKPGDYVPRDGADCHSADVVTWDGHSFEGEYVALGQIIKTEALGGGAFKLTARPIEGQGPAIWFADVKLTGDGGFLMRQYQVGSASAAGDFKPYAYCKP